MDEIKLYRELLGMTQQELASILGVKRSTVAMYEAGNPLSDRSKILLGEFMSENSDDLLKAIREIKRTLKRIERQLKAMVKIN